MAAGDGLWQMAFGRDLLFGRPPLITLGGVKRLTGTFHHSNDLAIFLTAGLPIAISGAMLLKKHSLRLVAAGAASLLLAAVLLGYSRSGLMAMVASLVFLSDSTTAPLLSAYCGRLTSTGLGVLPTPENTAVSALPPSSTEPATSSS